MSIPKVVSGYIPNGRSSIQKLMSVFHNISLLRLDLQTSPAAWTPSARFEEPHLPWSLQPNLPHNFDALQPPSKNPTQRSSGQSRCPDNHITSVTMASFAYHSNLQQSSRVAYSLHFTDDHSSSIGVSPVI
jgi:hypothetical protein